MENKFQTSFIPKKPLTQGFSRPARTTNFFSLITTVIFVTVLALCGGVWGYQNYLKTQNQKAVEEIQAITAQFQPSLLAELMRLDNRLTTTKTLLANHLAVSTFFDFLGKHTLKNVRFASFSYTVADSRISVAMKGQAVGFAAVALQAQAFNTQEVLQYFKSPTISDFGLDSSGNVSFGFGTFIQPNAMLYRNVVTPLAVPSVPAATVVTGTTTASTTQR